MYTRAGLLQDALALACARLSADNPTVLRLWTSLARTLHMQVIDPLPLARSNRLSLFPLFFSFPLSLSLSLCMRVCTNSRALQM